MHARPCEKLRVRPCPTAPGEKDAPSAHNEVSMAMRCRTVAQLGGFILSLFGWVSSCATTSVPLWKSLNLDLNEFEVWNMGLWQVCVVQDESVMECKDHPSLLALPWDVKLSRVLMVASNLVGFLAFSLSVLGSSWLKTRGQKPGLKKRLGTAGGILFCLSGIATFVPVSWVAYNVVQEFWDQALPEIIPRWEFGIALFLGWFAGCSLVLGGFLLLFSTCLPETERPSGEVAANRKQEMQRLPPTSNCHQYSPPQNTYLTI
uniref:Claudin-25 n=1 Tax=Pogona vitticeps TaxID=103695 RepID=A0A6J0TTY8_9SAUR